jgi:GT2 family glycosyltransferase
MPKVAVQLLSWNGEKYLRSVLASLAGQTCADFELLVMDSGSTDGSVATIEDALKNFPRPSRLIKLEENPGFAGGHNRLFALTQSEYVFCVNQDVVIADDYLARVIEFLDRTPDAGSASGVLRHADGSVDTAGLAKSWYGKIYDTTEAPAEKETRVFGVSGALPVYRRAAAIEASSDGTLFDGSFFSYKEDADLAWRLGNSGWSSFVLSDAKATHERAFGGDKKGNAAHYSKQKLSSRNHLLTLVKDLPGRELWRLPIIVFYELGKAAYLAVFVPKALGYIPEFFKLLPNALKVRKVFWSRLKAARN